MPSGLSLMTAANTGLRAREVSPSVPATESALARLLAMVLRRTDCAAIAEPAISEIFLKDMRSLLLLAVDGFRQALELHVDEGQAGLEVGGVLRERGLLDADLDRVAVAGGV